MFEWVGDDTEGPEYEHVSMQAPGDELLVMDVDSHNGWISSDTFMEVRQ